MNALRILHVLGQRPEMTGSGIYVEALIRESRKRGIACCLIAGVPKGRRDPSEAHPCTNRNYVFFETKYSISRLSACRMSCPTEVLFSVP